MNDSTIIREIFKLDPESPLNAGHDGPFLPARIVRTDDGNRIEVFTDHGWGRIAFPDFDDGEEINIVAISGSLRREKRLPVAKMLFAAACGMAAAIVCGYLLACLEHGRLIWPLQ